MLRHLLGKALFIELSDTHQCGEFKDGVVAEQVFVFLAVIDNLTGHYFQTNPVCSDLSLLHLRGEVNHLLEDQQIFAHLYLL
jgi:hypothetical protein